MPKRSPTHQSLSLRQGVIDKYLKEISAGWYETTRSILAVAKTCADANAQLDADAKRELLNELPFGASVFSKLAKIGADPRLKKQAVAKLLPPNYSTIYEVSHLSDTRLADAVRAKVLSPQASRAQIVSFVQNKNGDEERQDTGDDPHKALLAEIRLSKDINKPQLAKIVRWLQNLNEESPGSVVFGSDLPAYERLLNRHQTLLGKRETMVLRKMRSLIRKRISRMKNDKTRGHKWGFLPDETNLNVLDHELRERIVQVLGTLGFESDYDAIYREADELIDYSAVKTAEEKLAELFPFEITSVEPSKIHRPNQAELKASRKAKFAKLKVQN